MSNYKFNIGDKIHMIEKGQCNAMCNAIGIILRRYIDDPDSPFQTNMYEVDFHLSNIPYGRGHVAEEYLHKI